VAKKDGVEQVNVRVSQEIHEILEIAIFAKRLRGMQDLLLPVIEGYARELAALPEIQAIARSRQEHGARHAGKLSRLPAKKQADKSS
jgi:hypothetical protein